MTGGARTHRTRKRAIEPIGGRNVSLASFELMPAAARPSVLKCCYDTGISKSQAGQHDQLVQAKLDILEGDCALCASLNAQFRVVLFACQPPTYASFNNGFVPYLRWQMQIWALQRSSVTRYSEYLEHSRGNFSCRYPYLIGKNY